MKRSLMLALLCLALLSGCAANQPAGDSEPPVSPGVEPNIPDTPDTLAAPPQTEFLSYEEYFSEIRRYPSTGENSRPAQEPEEGCPVCGTTRSDGFCVEVEDGRVYARKGYNRTTGTFEYEWLIAETEDFRCLLADEDWIYGIGNGGTLFRMGWYGEDRQDLIASSEVVNGIRETDTLYLADGQVLFFMSGDDIRTIYRLHIPSRTLDVPVTDLSGDATLGLGAPISNHEVVWYSQNPDFYDLYETLRNDSASDISKIESEDSAYGAVELLGVTSATLVHYCSTFTGEHEEALYDGIYYVNPNPPWWAAW